MNDFKPIPEAEKHSEFLRDVIDVLFKNVIFTSATDKVVLWKPPQELQVLFDFKLEQGGASHEKLLTLLKNVIKYSVKTGHPYFINQLFSG